MNHLLWLEQWFHSQCNGTWEHTHGIAIETTAEPGWQVRIYLRGTSFDPGTSRELKRMAASERDWMTCRVVEGTFEGFGGPLMLGPILQAARDWLSREEAAAGGASR